VWGRLPNVGQMDVIGGAVLWQQALTSVERWLLAHATFRVVAASALPNRALCPRAGQKALTSRTRRRARPQPGVLTSTRSVCTPQLGLSRTTASDWNSCAARFTRPALADEYACGSMPRAGRVEAEDPPLLAPRACRPRPPAAGSLRQAQTIQSIACARRGAGARHWPGARCKGLKGRAREAGKTSPPNARRPSELHQGLCRAIARGGLPHDSRRLNAPAPAPWGRERHL
jgi:hypothetical protein